MRAGGQTLTLLAASRNISILQSLAEGMKDRLALRRDAGSPAPSTLRGNLGTLEAAGAVVKHRLDSSPGALEYELAEPGRELLVVADGLERWLAAAPSGRHELGSDPARAAVKGLVDGWSTTVLAVLARGGLSLTELDKRILDVSYPTIERCLETMRLSGQLETGVRGSAGTPYTLTPWIRRGLAPLVLAARWEHRHQPEGASPVCRADIEGGFSLVAPLVEFPMDLSGICQLAVRVPDGEGSRRFLAALELRGGDISMSAVYPERKPDAWASAPTETWFSIVIEAESRGLRLRGDRELAQTVFERLHQALFAGVGELATTHRTSPGELGLEGAASS